MMNKKLLIIKAFIFNDLDEQEIIINKAFISTLNFEL